MTLGAYPKAFAVEFDPVISPAVSWILNGIVVTADSQSPQCASGITVPASGVSATAATLNGVVTPGGTDTTYTFEYGTTTGYGSSTAMTDAGSRHRLRREAVRHGRHHAVHLVGDRRVPAPRACGSTRPPA